MTYFHYSHSRMIVLVVGFLVASYFTADLDRFEKSQVTLAVITAFVILDFVITGYCKWKKSPPCQLSAVIERIDREKKAEKNKNE